MPVPLTPKAYEDLSGGLNTLSASTYLADGQFAYLENIQTDNDGSLSIRAGWADVGVAESTHLVGTGLFQLRPNGAANQLLKTCKDSPFTDAALKKRNGAAWSPISESGFTLADHNFCSFVQYVNAAYIFAAGGTNRIMQCTAGGVFTEIAGAPRAWYGALLLERLWAAGDPATPDTLYYSATSDPTNFTAGDSGTIDVAINDGDVLMGIAATFNRLLIFKRYSVYVVDGTDLASFTVQKVLADGGAVSSRAIIPIENRILYLSDKGWYETDGSTTRSISDLIRPTRQSLKRNRDSYAFALHHRRRSQYICVATSGSASANDVALTYKYDSAIQANSARSGGGVSWTYFSDFPFAAGAVVQNSGNDEDLYFLHNTNGKLLIYERNEAGTALTDDDGDSITLSARSKWMDHDAPNATKFWRRLTVVFRATGSATSWTCVIYLGVPASNYLQFVVTATPTGLEFQVFTDFDEATVQQTVDVTPPAGVNLTGVQKYIVDAQIIGSRIVRAN